MDLTKSVTIWQIYILQVANWSPVVIDLAYLHKMYFSMYISASIFKCKKN